MIIHMYTDPRQIPVMTAPNGKQVSSEEHASLHRAINRANSIAFKQQEGCPICGVVYAEVEQ